MAYLAEAEREVSSKLNTTSLPAGRQVFSEEERKPAALPTASLGFAERRAP